MGMENNGEERLLTSNDIIFLKMKMKQCRKKVTR